MVLTPAQARAFYDRFGNKQDAQGFYEDPALDDLVAHADFGQCRALFEFGAGTGKLAARLLKQQLPPTASYLGCDISSTMVELARQRLAAYGKRVRLEQSDGKLRFPLADAAVDRVLCTYVLDLLSEADSRVFFSEAQRVLMPQGRLCLASLTTGTTLLSRLVSSVCSALFRLRPALVGGCRPIHLQSYVQAEHWQVHHQQVHRAFGLSSEVLILIRKK